MHSAVRPLPASRLFIEIIFAAAVACCLLLPAGPAKAAQLTETQIQAISGLLRAFEVDEATVADVESILHEAESGAVLGVATSSPEHSDPIPLPAADVRYSPVDIEQFRASGISKQCSSGILSVYIAQGKTLLVRKNEKAGGVTMLLDSTGLYTWSSGTTTVYKSPFSTSTFAGVQKLLTCVDATFSAAVLQLPENMTIVDVPVRKVERELQPKLKVPPLISAEKKAPPKIDTKPKELERPVPRAPKVPKKLAPPTVATSTTSSVTFNYMLAYSDSFNENLAAVVSVIAAVPVVEAPIAMLTGTLTDLLVYAGIGQ